MTSRPVIKIYVEGGVVTDVDMAGLDADYAIVDHDNLAAEFEDGEYQVRHDMLGFYVLSREEAEHEDAGNPSAGFDGRDHWSTMELAKEALAEIMGS